MMRRGRTRSAGASIVLFSEARFGRVADSHHPEAPSASDIAWAHYSDHVDGFALAARVRPVARASAQPTNVPILPLRYYRGIAGAVVGLPWLLRDVSRAVDSASAVVVRLPGIVGMVAALVAKAKRVPYGAEIVGDIEDVLVARRRSWAARAASLLAKHLTRRVVSWASATRYVTRAALQSKYPPPPGRLTIAASSVRLPKEAFVERKVEPSTAGGFTLLSVGSQETTYKRHDLSLQVLAMLRSSAIDASLTLIGDGVLRSSLERLAQTLGVDEHVTFISAVGDSAALRSYLDAAHVLLHPSDTEGLPRVVIESLARGLPVVATNVGGLPEIVDADYLAGPGDVARLFETTRRLLEDPELRARVSNHNVQVAHGYSDEVSSQKYSSWCRALERLADQEVRTRPRVVHIIGSLNTGGAETVTVDLVRETEPYVESTIVSLTDPPGPLTERARSAGASVITCSLHPRRTFLFRLYHLLRRMGPDAVVSHVSLFSAVPLAVASLTGRIPVRIARMHSTGDGAPDTPGRLVYRAITRRVLRSSATEIVAVSRAAASFAVGKRRSSEAAGDPPCTVLRNGVDTARFVPSAERRRPDGRNPEGRPKVLLHIGRNHPDKNRRVLPEITQSLVASDARWQLWIVGGGASDDVSGAPAYEAALPSIRVLGERMDVVRLLQSTSVLILPSLREGLPGAILEALACGIPVVCSDLPTLRELADELPGITLVPPRSPARDWAAAVVEAATRFPAPALELRAPLIGNGWDVSASSKEWLRRLRHDMA